MTATGYNPLDSVFSTTTDLELTRKQSQNKPPRQLRRQGLRAPTPTLSRHLCPAETWPQGRLPGNKDHNGSVISSASSQGPYQAHCAPGSMGVMGNGEDERKLTQWGFLVEGVYK